jgi:hypothetical protein
MPISTIKHCLLFILIGLMLPSCTFSAGELQARDKFVFSNSDTTVAENANVSIDRSHTYFAFSQPPLREIYDEMLSEALRQSGNGTMLTNIKWVTTTTTYSIVPIYSYNLHLEAVAVKADVFQKKLD